MWKAQIRTYTVTVVPCAEKATCFRWVIRTAESVERSGYAFATAAGARASAESWRREFEAGKPMR